MEKSVTKMGTTAILLSHKERIEHIQKFNEYIKEGIIELHCSTGKYYYEFIKNEWKIIIQLTLAGVDDWHRPVFKDVNSRNYYGDVNCTTTGRPQTVIDYYKDNIDKLEYFGTKFNCEPNGGLNKSYKLEIID